LEPNGWFAAGLEEEIQSMDQKEKYNLILFCHSMYGMKPKHKFIEKALQLLVERPLGGVVVDFYRNGSEFQPLVFYKAASYPAGAVRLVDDDYVLDRDGAGFDPQGSASGGSG
jgi:hypothetical protein